MKVKIQLFATLREKYGKKEVIVDAINLRDAFYRASEILGDEFLGEVFKNDVFRDDRIITVNGRNIKDTGEIKIKEGDVIAVFPPIAGG